MIPRPGILLALVLSLFPSSHALSSWYTPPGGPPTGSTAGDKIRGVNLGGWFILENWMMPSFFEQSPLDQSLIPDEWHYCSILGKAECQQRLESHWDTYITEDDFKRFSDYGLNAVRIPIGYWAWTDLEDFEPYIQGQQPYLEKALNWSSYYGLDVMMDMHGLPGGQNGQDNQGIKGPIEFPNNSTNLDRAMDALSKLTAYVTQAKFNGVVTAIELTNEPYILQYAPNGMNFDVLADFYVKGYQAVRANEYIAAGAKETMVVIHDAFQPLLNWQYFWSSPQYGLNWTNYALDTHIYEAFRKASSRTQQEHLDSICSLASSLSAAQTHFPIIVGEFSLGTGTYCVDYTSCFGLTISNTISNLTDPSTSLFLRQFWEIQADVYELATGWIFWSAHNELGAPWSWSQSAAQNWIPQDPTAKLYPFYPADSSGCLDISHPLGGEGSLPSFPGDPADIGSIDISGVRPKGKMVQDGVGGSKRGSGGANATAGGVTATATPGSGSATAADMTSRSGAQPVMGGIKWRSKVSVGGAVLGLCWMLL